MSCRQKQIDEILDSACIKANRKLELETRSINELLIIIDDREKGFYERITTELIEKIIENKYDIEQ